MTDTAQTTRGTGQAMRPSGDTDASSQDPELDRLRLHRELVGASDGNAIRFSVMDIDSKWRAVLTAQKSTAVERGRIGLAMSGGGIRSAAFNLGVVQRLHAIGIYDRLDYMSSVSGGGYLAASLSSYHAWRDSGPVRAVGNNPPPDFPYELTDGGADSDGTRHLRAKSSFLSASKSSSVFHGPIFWFAGIGANFVVLAGIVLAMAGLLQILSEFAAALTDPGWLQAFKAHPPTLLALMLLAVSTVLSLPVVLLWDKLDGKAKSDPMWGALRSVLSMIVLTLAGCAAAILLVQAGVSLVTLVTSAVTGAVLATFGAWLAQAKIAERHLIKIGALLGWAAAAATALLIVMLAVEAKVWLVEPVSAILRAESFWTWLAGPLVALTGALLIVFVHLLPANYGSLHSFYRSRIRSMFDVRSAYAAKPEELVAPRLSDLQKGISGPLHLISATVNYRAGGAPAGAVSTDEFGRRADIFLFSPFMIGSRSSGYLDADAAAILNPGFDLFSAAAVAGAAVSPTMGNKTIPAFRAVLTLLNARLAFWMKWTKKARLGHVESLIREVTGSMESKQSEYLYLSDGGHSDNLGVYHLLERKCELIIAVDAEGDAGYGFSGMASALRIARIDFGYNAIFDTGQLDAIATGKSHFALARIQYDNKLEGMLVYIKASCTEFAKRNAFLYEYSKSVPTFPHESTADQFFDGRQFEAYRALGEMAAKQTFAVYTKP